MAGIEALNAAQPADPTLRSGIRMVVMGSKGLV